MRHFARLVVICVTVLRYGLDELALSSFPAALGAAAGPRDHDRPHASTRRAASGCASALERLGPIFVKFGQVLSTRRDLLPADIADELARLQDRVPPFPATRSRARSSSARSAGRIDAIFASFDADAGGQRLDRAGALRGR